MLDSSNGLLCQRKADADIACIIASQCQQLLFSHGTSFVESNMASLPHTVQTSRWFYEAMHNYTVICSCSRQCC